MRKATFGMLVTVLGASAALAQSWPIVDNIPGTWIEISGTGTLLPGGDDISNLITTTVGNALLPAGNVYVCSNGHLGLTQYTGYSNYPLPYSGFYAGGRGLAPFWDDLNTSAGGGVYWQEIGDTLIIEWKDVPHYYNVGAATFQVQIFGSGYLAQFLYQDMDFGDPGYNYGISATVGYQWDSTTAVQWSYNQAVITDGLVLTIVPEPASLLLIALGALGLRRR